MILVHGPDPLQLFCNQSGVVLFGFSEKVIATIIDAGMRK